MTLTETRDLVRQVDIHVEGARLAAESAMEVTQEGDARLHQAEAYNCASRAETVAKTAHHAAVAAIQTGARGGTLCSSKDEWDIAVYTARAAAEAKLHLAVATEAFRSLVERDYFTN